MENRGSDKPLNEFSPLEIHDTRFLKGYVNWDELYKEVYPMILNWILERKAPYDWAKEICQDSFLIFYRKLNDPLFRLECKASTFVVAIARNLYFNRVRKNARHLQMNDMADLEIKEEVPGIHQILEENRLREEQILRMERSLNRLGAPCSEILKDFYFRNYDMQRIAEKFGYTNADNAKTQKYKCLQRLKRFFFNQDEK